MPDQVHDGRSSRVRSRTDSGTTTSAISSTLVRVEPARDAQDFGGYLGNGTVVVVDHIVFHPGAFHPVEQVGGHVQVPLRVSASLPGQDPRPDYFPRSPEPDDGDVRALQPYDQLAGRFTALAEAD